MSTQSHLIRKPKAVQNVYTPPMSNSIHSQSREDIESYFSKPYIPLSSLPTPPLCTSSSLRRTSRPTSPDLFCSGPDELLSADLLGPALHLTNLIPSSTSLTTPSVPFVHAMLSRAELPIEILALAVCILDSLNSRFALSWRKQLPLLGEHIDEVHPELIALSALIVAHKFSDDTQLSTQHYANEWGRDTWSNEQINFTQRCILENLDYSIAPLWEESMVREAVEDMELAGRYRSGELETCVGDENIDDHEEGEMDWEGETCFGSPPPPSTETKLGLGTGSGMSMGTAMIGFGDQPTPVETPGMRGESCDFPSCTKKAFRYSTGTLGEGKALTLPLRRKLSVQSQEKERGWIHDLE